MTAVCKCTENTRLDEIGKILDIHNMWCPVFIERTARNAAESLRGWTIPEKKWHDAAFDEYRVIKEGGNK